MVALDEAGDVVRPALLWNDTRSAGAAADLTAELGGPEAWARRGRPGPRGVVHGHQAALAGRPRARRPPPAPPPSASRTTGSRGGWPERPAEIVTDRSDASGTGYWSAADRRVPPRPAGPRPGPPGSDAPRWPRPTRSSAPARAPTGCSGRAAATTPGPPSGSAPSRATSSSRSAPRAWSPPCHSCRRPTPPVRWPASPTPPGHFLPLVATLNAAQVLDVTARLLGVDHAGLSDLALSAPPGADGVVLVPYLQGERTPDRPDATGSFLGLTLAGTTPANLARAAVEGLWCGLADGLAALRAQGADGRPGPAGRWRRGVTGGPRRSVPRCWVCRSTCRRPRSTSRWAPPVRPRGCSTRRPVRPPGRARCDPARCRRPTRVRRSGHGTPRPATSPSAGRRT